jgi:hypothetical protein
MSPKISCLYSAIYKQQNKLSELYKVKTQKWQDKLDNNGISYESKPKKDNSATSNILFRHAREFNSCGNKNPESSTKELKAMVLENYTHAKSYASGLLGKNPALQTVSRIGGQWMYSSTTCILQFLSHET